MNNERNENVLGFRFKFRVWIPLCLLFIFLSLSWLLMSSKPKKKPSSCGCLMSVKQIDSPIGMNPSKCFLLLTFVEWEVENLSTKCIISFICSVWFTSDVPSKIRETDLSFLQTVQSYFFMHLWKVTLRKFKLLLMTMFSLDHATKEQRPFEFSQVSTSFSVQGDCWKTS